MSDEQLNGSAASNTEAELLTTEDLDPGNAESSWSEWDSRILRLFAETLRFSDEANPSSWAVKRNISGSISLFVESVTVLVIRPNGGDFALQGDRSQPIFDALNRHRIGGKYVIIEAFSVQNLNADDLIEYCNEFQRERYNLILNQARAVKTRTQWASSHDQKIVQDIESELKLVLPSPNYLSSLLASRPTKPRFWKISPGSNAAEWDTFRKRDIIALSWSDRPEDLSNLPATRDAFREQIKELLGVSNAGAISLWQFINEMQEGDQVIPYGNKTVLGYGTIVGPYFFGQDDFKFHHRRPMRWESLQHRPISAMGERLQSKLMTNATIVELTAAEFREAIENENTSPSYILDSLKTIQSHFDEHGLRYTRAQIGTFYTALQTKGFVVLSGISGTGKSKIAQGFVEILPFPSAEHLSLLPPEGYLSFQVSQTQTWVAIDATQSTSFPLVDRDARQEVTYRFNGFADMGHAIVRTLAGGKPTLYLSLGSDLTNRLRQHAVNGRAYAQPQLSEDGSSLSEILLSIGDRPTEQAPRLSNSLFLAVRPDWRDSTSLLGYYNPLTETYEWTEFLRFLLRAKESFRQKDGLAWFVILDEMNLAHVEYYFADLLSIIESGRDDEGWSREAIRLTYPDTLTDNAPPHAIKLPPNLYIIGTVNMDETTHAFSPKVLDRAFTIELTEVDFSDYPPVTPATTVHAAGQELPEAEQRTLLKAFTRDGTFAQVSKVDIRQAVDDHPEIRLWLQNLNERLEQHQFHFGYRVFDEIAQFIFNADRNGMFDDWHAAFDHAVYMKVLPKFNGSHARLHGPLTALRDWANTPGGVISVPVNSSGDPDEGLPSTPNGGPRLDRVATRAERMLALLDANGFVSFG